MAMLREAGDNFDIPPSRITLTLAREAFARHVKYGGAPRDMEALIAQAEEHWGLAETEYARIVNAAYVSDIAVGAQRRALARLYQNESAQWRNIIEMYRAYVAAEDLAVDAIYEDEAYRASYPPLPGTTPEKPVEPPMSRPVSTRASRVRALLRDDDPPAPGTPRRDPEEGA